MQKMLAAGFELDYEALTSADHSGKFPIKSWQVSLHLFANKHKVSIYQVYEVYIIFTAALSTKRISAHMHMPNVKPATTHTELEHIV